MARGYPATQNPRDAAGSGTAGRVVLRGRDLTRAPAGRENAASRFTASLEWGTEDGTTPNHLPAQLGNTEGTQRDPHTSLQPSPTTRAPVPVSSGMEHTVVSPHLVLHCYPVSLERGAVGRGLVLGCPPAPTFSPCPPGEPGLAGEGGHQPEDAGAVLAHLRRRTAPDLHADAQRLLSPLPELCHLQIAAPDRLPLLLGVLRAPTSRGDTSGDMVARGGWCLLPSAALLARPHQVFSFLPMNCHPGVWATLQDCPQDTAWASSYY